MAGLKAERWYTRKEAAILLGQKESTLRRWAVENTGPSYIKTGTAVNADVRYPESEIAKWQSQFPLVNRRHIDPQGDAK